MTSPEFRPSPTPIGCAIGFMAVPRTRGRIPFQRLRPALQSRYCYARSPKHTNRCTATTIGNRRTSRWASNRAHRPSRAFKVAPTPALRHNWPPRPGCISILWITVPGESRSTAYSCRHSAPEQDHFRQYCQPLSLPEPECNASHHSGY